MKIYESAFVRLEYLLETASVEMTWLSATSEMTAEQYKKECLEHLKVFLNYAPHKIFINAQALSFPITHELQSWTISTVYRLLFKVGMQKLALLESRDFITRLAYEQMLESITADNFSLSYFQNKEEAYHWLAKEFATSEYAWA